MTLLSNSHYALIQLQQFEASSFVCLIFEDAFAHLVHVRTVMAKYALALFVRNVMLVAVAFTLIETRLKKSLLKRLLMICLGFAASPYPSFCASFSGKVTY